MNVRLLGSDVNVDAPVAFTFKTTGTVVVWVPDVRLINPPYDPFANEPGVAVTVRTSGVVPLAGVTASQFVPEKDEAVKLTVVPLLETTKRFCVAVELPPVTLNVSCVGEAVITPVCAGNRLARPKKTKTLSASALCVKITCFK